MDAPPPPSVKGQFADWRRREALLLAPYAMKGADSEGRKYLEADHPYRSPYQRDRDRIVHCSAFRRLSGKMQVFAGDRGDYHRTRLTHSQEVASIARTIGRTLQLNEDLIESLALMHDIGHPPYGHSGEEVLQRLLADEGGFSHNRHALIIVEELESRNSDYPGLNLSQEVLQGQFARTGQTTGRLLEAQVVDAADSIAYNAHDVDDGVKLGLLDLEEIAETPLVQQAYARAVSEISLNDSRRLRKAVAYNLVDMMVQDLLGNAGAELLGCEFGSAKEAMQSSFRIRQSEAIIPQKAAMQRWLFDRLYRHPQLIQMRSEVADRLETMFEGYIKKPE
ncbi:MAG: dNTP triphosphohydrolase, partial [bacterium]|nr:dNTP triphosphohydrolase [bacterium]